MSYSANAVLLWIAALAGMPLLLLAFRTAGVAPLGWAPRIALWVLAGLLLLLVDAAGLVWSAPHAPAGATVVAALLALVTVCACMPMLQRAQGGPSEQQRSVFAALAHRPFGQRLFIVLTAAVVEELLYRALGIGLGQRVVGSVPLAAALSLAAFTVAHARWGLAHLLPVAVAGAALTGLYIATGSLVACIIVHFLIDAVGVLVIPALLARRGLLPPPPESTP